ncbi:glucosaminidase domain-containing protein [Desulfurobacterium atlanticum]|uniref:Bax protein n=1 Tax=Desulfurobacterium atlanticum TaxID=240169 RepID=A0A238YVV5_9BACT|nr:glucosaminidase domain-containing protein [Desulfurobacterium atlanticum]SNR74764.1 Bax protein [Desulfurobacterium atlanticum]
MKKSCFFLFFFVILFTISGCETKQENFSEKRYESSVKTKPAQLEKKVESETFCEEISATPNFNKERLLKLPPPKRKKLFISIITPAVLKANCIIEKERKVFLKIKGKIESGKQLTEKEKQLLEKLKKNYESNDLNELYYRINTLPPSIVIAQAAIESGWGTSRFFIEGNNLFGIWTFSNSTEHIKAKYGKAKVKKYKSPLYSIEDYYHNINTGWAYEELRKARLKTKDPLILADYLKNYSILREEYVRRIKRVITKNNLQKFDKCTYTNCTIDL